MVQSIIDLRNREDKVLNIIKAQNGFKNKSQAVEFVLNVYEESFLEPELKPEFIEKLKKIKQQKGIRFKSIMELRKHIEKEV
ncbi:MAG: DUF2683 family protein [Nanoarchaeota archaeon]